MFFKIINIFLILLSSFFIEVFAIDCYQCVSVNTTDVSGQACRNPFDQWNVPYIKKCKQRIAGHSQEAFACVKIVQKIEETGQETIIRDCVAIPMKQGCEKREMSNYKLYGGLPHSMTQCVYICHESNGCNKSILNKLNLTYILINLITLIYLSQFFSNQT